jgi:hypothetical protein
MKKITLFTLFIVYAALSQAQLLLNESFDYPIGSGLVGSGDWIAEGSSITNPIMVTTSSQLTYSNYTSCIGSEVSLTSSGQDVSHIFTSQKTGSIYYSLLVNLSAAKSAGDYFIHLVSSSAFIGQVYAKLDGSKIAFGILNATGGSYTPTYTASIYDLNTTYLLIVKVDVVTGTSELIINPETLAYEPISGWISSSSPANGGVGGTTVPTTSGIGKINLRQGGSSSGPTLKLDEIRVSTSYNSVLTGISVLNADVLKVSITGKRLTVTDSPSSIVEIFNTSGSKVESLQLINGSTNLDLEKGFYIVRIGNKSTKILK